MIERGRGNILGLEGPTAAVNQEEKKKKVV
jgi:hypothetical protein